MKSYLGSAAAIMVATFSMVEKVDALEHPMLASTEDFVETWTDRPRKTDMITKEKERRESIMIDHGKRPVIGVLTEPIRGDLFKRGEERMG